MPEENQATAVGNVHRKFGEVSRRGSGDMHAYNTWCVPYYSALDYYSAGTRRAEYCEHEAAQYMTDCCIYTTDIARRQHLPGGR